MKIYLSILFIASSSILAFGATDPIACVLPASGGGSFLQYYVSTSGDDRNPGTSLDQPWRTIQRAMCSATPGSTVNILPGTYKEMLTMQVSGTEGNYITFQPYAYQTGDPGPDSVFIDGDCDPTQSHCTIWPWSTSLLLIDSKSYIRMQGLTFRNFRVRGGVAFLIENTSGNLSSRSHHIELRNNKFVNLHYEGDYLPETAIEALGVYDSDQIVVRGNEFGDITAGQGEALACNTCTNFLIENNHVHDVDNIAIDAASQGIPGREGGYGTIRGNLVERIGGNPRDGSIGIYVSETHDTLVERNLVRNGLCPVQTQPCLAFFVGIAVTPEPTFPDSYNNTIRNNIVYGYSTGISVGYPYDFRPECKTTDCSLRIRDIKVLNNTLYNNDTSIGIGTATNVLWANNIAVGNQSVVSAGSPNHGVGHSFDYNLFAGDWLSGRDYSNCDQLLDQLGEAFFDWSGAHHAHSVCADPGFVDPSAPDLHIGLLSPARNAGNPDSQTSDVGEVDFDGNPRIQEGRVDIGAYEFQP